MLINGTADPINPYRGGIVRLFGFASRGTVMSSIASAQNLAERNGIVSPPVRSQLSNGISHDPTFVETLTWNTDGRASFCLYTVSQPSLAAISSQSHLLPTRNSSQCLEPCASRVVSLRYLSKQALRQNCFHAKRWRTRPKRPLHMSHRRLLTLFEPGTMKEICAL